MLANSDGHSLCRKVRNAPEWVWELHVHLPDGPDLHHSRSLLHPGADDDGVRGEMRFRFKRLRRDLYMYLPDGADVYHCRHLLHDHADGDGMQREGVRFGCRRLRGDDQLQQVLFRQSVRGGVLVHFEHVRALLHHRHELQRSLYRYEDRRQPLWLVHDVLRQSRKRDGCLRCIGVPPDVQ